MGNSIILPVYNVAPYLRKWVSSVLQQTHNDLEVILVDDGAMDGSGELCEQLASEDTRIKAVHQTNQGLSAARNTGIHHATGDYLAFLDGDDEYLIPDGLQQLAAIAEQNKPDIILFQAVDVYPNHQITRPEYEVQWIARHTTMQVFERLVVAQRFQMSACFQLINRAFLTKHNLLFEKGLLSEDVDWSLRLWKQLPTVRACNIPMYAYKHREGSISTSYTLRNLQSYATIFAMFQKRYEQETMGIYNPQIVQITEPTKHTTGTETTTTTPAPSVYWRVALGYLAQMYTSCLYAYAQIPSSDREKAFAILQENAWLLEHSISKKSNRVVWLKKRLGLRITIIVFAIYGVLKRTIRR